jgi:hypothetical protein
VKAACIVVTMGNRPVELARAQGKADEAALAAIERTLAGGGK